ncbi:HTH-type transcriptional regulator BetI, partial [Striga asiatica]
VHCPFNINKIPHFTSTQKRLRWRLLWRLLQITRNFTSHNTPGPTIKHWLHYWNFMSSLHLVELLSDCSTNDPCVKSTVINGDKRRKRLRPPVGLDHVPQKGPLPLGGHIARHLMVLALPVSKRKRNFLTSDGTQETRRNPVAGTKLSGDISLVISPDHGFSGLSGSQDPSPKLEFLHHHKLLWSNVGWLHPPQQTQSARSRLDLFDCSATYNVQFY